ncbi:MAG: UDP-glucose 6-dehydrogenase, partial [Alphaproteobacteria bacterium]|nr:UDP-glucose 6-dehydrogenase [Alphaproteobacteria bacterium]
GSCFPKDTEALVRSAQDAQAPVTIVEQVVAVNAERKEAMARKIIAACGGSVDGKTVAVLGLTFKPNTDDMRESPSLVIVPRLMEAGATVRAFDPVGMAEAEKLLYGPVWCGDAYDAMDGADAVVILTEWNEFRGLDFQRMLAVLKQPIMIDLRNIYRPEEMAAAGFHYTSVGRVFLPPAG